ncbi:PAQRB-like protein [Mya arenaria]|uniref:PAQRB-like protein n=1 Tax=Mya arenaria TaxID=6604 RepID=A0ABY7DK00_MYAAR|nr:PAQRB-like protein [Mya arenaria]
MCEMTFGSIKKSTPCTIHDNRLKNERASHGEHYKPTDLEHLANMFTHGICIFPSLYGLKIMQERASSPTEVAALLIYGMALFFLFTTSTMYHSLSFARTKRLLLKDFGGVDNFFMWVVWVGAVLGIIYQFLFHSKYKSLEVVFYLIIGICPAYAVTHMTDPSGVHELAVGGVIYVAGVLFFKCDGIIPFAHAIWHCFVFLGAFVHFYAINTYLVGQHGKTENIVDRMV